MQKKCLFGSKTVFLGQEVHYYMVYIAYFTALILQICDHDAFDTKIVNTRLTKNFMAIFAPNERLPSSATLYENEKGDNFQVYWNGRQFIFLQAGVVYIIAGKNEANFGRRFKKIQAEQILDYCLLCLSTCLKEILRETLS